LSQSELISTLNDVSFLQNYCILREIMEKLKLSALNIDLIQSVIQLEEKPIDNYPWLAVDHIDLSEDDQQQIQTIVRRLRKSSTNLLNEATVWGKAIFPLFLLAEQGNIEAWAEVPLSAQYSQFTMGARHPLMRGKQRGFSSISEKAYWMKTRTGRSPR
jgi:hypothetical protein